MKIVESTVNPKEHKLTENLSRCLKKIPAQVLLSGDHRTPVFIQNPPDEGLVPGVPGVGAGTRVWGPEVAVWSSTMALSCLKGPEEVCKSTDFRPSGGGPEGCHFCRERETEGLNSCLGSAANLERALKSILYPSGSPFSLF